MNVALTGDVMLGRLVDRYVITNDSLGPDALWTDMLPLMMSADARLVNLECVISARGSEWRPLTKAFHFRAHPRAIEFLRAAGVDGVAVANNHVLDYGREALHDCLALLDRAGIVRTGAGLTLAEATEPASIERSGVRMAVLALTDNEPDWEASDRDAGVYFVSYDDHGLREPYRTSTAQLMHRVRAQADFVVVSAHVGPNWGAPSISMRALAHELIDLGADVYWGHSNHTPQGIELYRDGIILYSAGDFVDDYAVDETERNDLSFLFMVRVEGRRASRITLHPTCIENYRVRSANRQEAAFLARTMADKCEAFGTPLTFQGGVGTISVR